MGRESRSKSSEANGCIPALYHFFHSHHFYFPSRHHHHQPAFDSPSRYPKGLVAPRNSLELTEESPLSTNYKGKESLNMTVGGKSSNLRALLFDTSSDNCNSPISAKSPNLVARLMGLDLLPDHDLDLNKPSRKSVRGHRLTENCSGTTRSLPGSPRVSSARKSDSDDARRLSLQLNRENKHEDSVCWRLKDEENGNNERVITRRFGLMDITNLLENRRAGPGEDQNNKHRKVRSMSSRKENTLSSSPTFVFKQDKISQQPTRKLTRSKHSKENLKSVDEQPLRPTNVCMKVCSKSKFSPHSTPNNQHKHRQAFISTSRCDLLHKKNCKQIPNSSAVSASERPRKQMVRKEPEQKEDGTICPGQMYNYEEKLPQELVSSSSATFSNVGRTKIYFEYLRGMKKFKKEEEMVVAEIERHIVDALVLETVKMACV